MQPVYCPSLQVSIPPQLGGPATIAQQAKFLEETVSIPPQLGGPATQVKLHQL